MTQFSADERASFISVLVTAGFDPDAAHSSNAIDWLIADRPDDCCEALPGAFLHTISPQSRGDTPSASPLAPMLRS